MNKNTCCTVVLISILFYFHFLCFNMLFANIRFTLIAFLFDFTVLVSATNETSANVTYPPLPGPSSFVFVFKKKSKTPLGVNFD